MKELNKLRTTSILEGISFIILLFIAMPLKYKFGLPIAVKITGSLHGLLFVLLIVFLADAKGKNLIPMDLIIKIFIASLIPFGTFFMDKKIKAHI
ncbi:MAG: DUF3817 domain-containing protein [Candidatus Sericytochromatia bacterium]